MSLKLDQDVYKFGLEDLCDVVYKVNFVDECDIENVFLICFYYFSYLVDFKLKCYEGVYLIYDIFCFFDDYFEFSYMR